MKKTILILSLLIISNTINAQWFNKTIRGDGNVITKTIETDDYQEIAVLGFFDVFLISGQEGNISIKAESNLMDYIIITSKNNQLKIKLKKNISIKTKKGVFITVPFKDLEKISLHGSGDIVSKNYINTNIFETILSGSGDIKLDINADKIMSKITGSGDITIQGKTDELTTNIIGSGDFVSKELKAKTVKVLVTGSGDATVYADNKLEAKVIGSGDIVFYGNPLFEKTTTIGSGDIISK